MNQKYILGVDIGGTWIRAALCSQELKNKQIKIKIIKTLKKNKFSISKSVNQLLTELLNENNIKREQVIGIGLACAGPLDIKKGESFNNPNLGFKIIPLKKPIQENFPDIPLYLINDCNGAVLGIHYFEAKSDEKDNLVYISMSTGIGGGVICNGHLLFGKDGNAAEVGHSLVDPKSVFKCNCGAYGCWEVYSSGSGVKMRTIKALRESELKAEILMNIINNDISKITAKEVFQAARKGDELSKKIVDECIFYSKVGIGLINNYYDVSTIYLGGSMLKDKEQIFPPLVKQFKNDPIKFTINHPPKIKITKLGDEVGLRGALTLVKYNLVKDPTLDLFLENQYQ
ncbi:MAG: ROK family protein [Promethearchaeota archaeon]